MPTKAHKAAGGRLCRSLALAWAMVLALPAWGVDWYVRPAEGTYGTSNGTSYANAFDGFADITWGVGQVNTGDTLYVCGSFDRDSIDGGQTMLLIEAAGVIIDGDCSGQGGLAKAVMDGETTQDYAIFCNTTALCLGTTIRNVSIKNFDRRGIYVRSDLSTTAASNVTISTVDITDIVGLEANLPQGIAGFGSGATLSNITVARTTDDAIHWEGDDFVITDWRVTAPAYLATTNLGDCVQVAVQVDNARARRGYCDHTNNATKQCVAFTDFDVSDNNAEISVVQCYFPETGNSTYNTKPLYSDVPGTQFLRNYVVGGEYGIYMLGAGSTAESNIVRGQEVRGIDAPSTVTSGTHYIQNNTVSDAGIGIRIDGGASVTTNVYNNVVVNNTTGIAKGGSSTVNHGNNAGFGNTANNNGCCSPLAITADPQFVGGTYPTTIDGFRLSASSPLAGAGTDLGDEIADFFGDYMYNGKWDIGAFRRDSCYRRSRDGKLDMARTRSQVASRCLGIPGRYPEGL